MLDLASRFGKKPQEKKKFNLFDFGKETVGGARNVVGGFTSEAIASPFRLAGGIGKAIGTGMDYIAPGLGKGATELGENIQGFGEGTKKFLTKYGGVEQDKMTTKIGEKTAQFGEALIGPGKYLKGAKTGMQLLKGGAITGALSTPLYTGLSEGRLPTIGEQITGTVGGALLTPLTGKAIQGIAKGLTKASDKIKLMRNPEAFIQKLDDDTKDYVVKLFKPKSVGGVTAKEKGEDILLTGVKDLVNRGEKPTSIKEAALSARKVKEKLLNEQKISNEAVDSAGIITKSDDLAADIEKYLSENASDLEPQVQKKLKETAIKLKSDKYFKNYYDNLSQTDLQNKLTEVNSKLSDKDFLTKTPDAEIAERVIMSRILRDRLDTNLMNAVGGEGNQALRNEIGRMIRLEKELTKAWAKSEGKTSTGILGAYNKLLIYDVAKDLIEGRGLNAAVNILKKVKLSQELEKGSPDYIWNKIMENQLKLKGKKLPSKTLQKSVEPTKFDINKVKFPEGPNARTEGVIKGTPSKINPNSPKLSAGTIVSTNLRKKYGK